MTYLFLWQDGFAIDDETVDQEHQHLLELANEVLSIEAPRENLKQLKEAINKLFRYTEYHFANEETVMEKVEYPGLEDHKALHKEILIKMSHMIKSCNDLDEYSSMLKQFMSDWVITHIMQEDKDIGKYISQTISQ